MAKQAYENILAVYFVKEVRWLGGAMVSQLTSSQADISVDADAELVTISATMAHVHDQAKRKTLILPFDNIACFEQRPPLLPKKEDAIAPSAAAASAAATPVKPAPHKA